MEKSAKEVSFICSEGCGVISEDEVSHRSYGMCHFKGINLHMVERTSGIEIKPGIVVKLKSGGPHMVIDYVCADNNFVMCQWFDACDRWMERSFKKGLLVGVE